MPKNCWEYKLCGRQPGGPKANEYGPCPAATEVRADGLNQGKNAGRCCWAIAGTLCKGDIQGIFAQKMGNCMQCDFYNLVGQEQGRAAVKTRDVLSKLN